jgi:hypothetical protein
MSSLEALSCGTQLPDIHSSSQPASQQPVSQSASQSVGLLTSYLNVWLDG